MDGMSALQEVMLTTSTRAPSVRVGSRRALGSRLSYGAKGRGGTKGWHRAARCGPRCRHRSVLGRRMYAHSPSNNALIFLFYCRERRATAKVEPLSYEFSYFFLRARRCTTCRF